MTDVEGASIPVRRRPAEAPARSWIVRLCLLGKGRRSAGSNEKLRLKGPRSDRAGSSRRALCLATPLASHKVAWGKGLAGESRGAFL
jgi:hypothetical protein